MKEKSTVNRQIKVGAMLSYVALFVNILVSLLYTPWLVSHLGQSNYALFTLATSFISLFLLDFGLSASVSRYVAKYRAENDNGEKIGRFISTIEWLYLAIDILILLVLFVIYFFLGTIYKGLRQEELETYRSLYIIVATYSVVSFPFMPLSGIINAYEKFVQQKACELFQKLFFVSLVVVALTIHADVRFVVMANAVSGLSTILIKIFIIRKSIGLKLRVSQFDWALAKNVFSFSIWVMVISVAQRCVFSLAPTILGMVSNSKEIATFAPASAMESYFFLIAAAINGLFMATVSRHIANKCEDKIMNLAIKVGRYQLMVLGCVFIGFTAAGKQFMFSWMGPEYVGAYPCAVLLFIPDILLLSHQIANITAIAKNCVKEQALGYVGMGAICLLVSAITVRKLGAMGSAIAISISYFFLFAYMNVLYKKVLHFDVIYFFKKTYLPFALPFGVGTIAAVLLPKFISLNGWSAVFVYGGAAAFVYLLFIIPILNNEERSSIKGIFLKAAK